MNLIAPKLRGTFPMFVVFLTGCVVQPSDKYANTENNIEPDAKDRRTVKIVADKAWQKPGAYLVKDAKVQIRARGS